MLTATTSAVPHIQQGRARAMCASGRALAAALAWIVEVPLLGIDLNFRFGAGHIQTTPRPVRHQKDLDLLVPRADRTYGPSLKSRSRTNPLCG